MGRLLRYIKNNLKNMDKWLLFFCIILSVFGLFSIVSASTRESVVTYDFTLYHYFNQQLKMLLIALAAGFIIINVPTKTYGFFGGLAYIILLIANIATLYFGDDKGRGNSNWLPIGSFKFQPSEPSKPVIIICLACLFGVLYKALRNKDNPKRWNGIMVIVMTMVSIPFAIYYCQGDLGTTLLIAGIIGVMFLASPILKKDKLITAGIILFFGMLWITGNMLLGNKGLSDSQSGRFDKFWEPCNNYEDQGYQVCNALIAINNGGIGGRGVGGSQQKYSYIPDPHTDMIFAIIAEENGLILCTIVFALFFSIISRILSLANVANTISNKYICVGIATYIMLHIIINLGGLFALIPLTGVPLPFLSYGGTFTISLLCSLAVIQRIYIESKMEYEKKRGINNN